LTKGIKDIEHPRNRNTQNKNGTGSYWKYVQRLMKTKN
jgi:hypothetical protein